MTVYAIGDLHLPAEQKPMDVFGPHWIDHFQRISEDWRARVSDEDVVLIPGDITWAMQLDAARPDLNAIGALPGRKIITRGNHDFWWSAIGRVRDALPEGMYALQNDGMALDGVLFAGTRGWTLAMDADADPADRKIFQREQMRLEMSLKSARRLSETLPLVVMMHYPPLTESCRETPFTQLLNRYRADHVVYGHLHGPALYGAFKGVHDGVRYHQVSCDGLNFRLHEVMRPTGDA